MACRIIAEVWESLGPSAMREAYLCRSLPGKRKIDQLRPIHCRAKAEQRTGRLNTIMLTSPCDMVPSLQKIEDNNHEHSPLGRPHPIGHCSFVDCRHRDAHAIG